MQRRNFLKAAAAVAALQVLPAADLLAAETSPLPTSSGRLEAPVLRPIDPWNKRQSGVWVPMTYGVQNTATPTSTYTHQFNFWDGDFILDSLMQTGNVTTWVDDRRDDHHRSGILLRGDRENVKPSHPCTFRHGDSCQVTIENSGPRPEPFGVFLFGQEKLRV